MNNRDDRLAADCRLCYLAWQLEAPDRRIPGGAGEVLRVWRDLDRRLSGKRIFPAIDIGRSGTRREDLLMTPEELEAIWAMRRAMSNLPPQEVTETIIDNLAHTTNNRNFIQIIKKVLVNR